ncbi:GntR family transcriptional regulator [Acidisphaera sp. L21]|uniref:GntR family transcriptional regulator n=1 Tax=Acidisphaera sp. L21 TaxID=1641851 RepID=UPI00131E61C9|nr:GntR family transcriptional regulator [Acidisphaera sp. L21]
MSNTDPTAPAARALQAVGDLQPRYATVATAIATDILDGRRPVGQMLPPEGELCVTYGVSRSTVREALRRLRELGLVEAIRGVGTRIIADQPRSNYVLAAQSIADVMGYAGPTSLEITGRDDVVANAALAHRLGCEEGSGWCHVVGVRRSDKAAISCVDLYIAAEFAAIADDPALVTIAAYRLVAQQLGIVVAEIKQEIGAIALSEAQAAVLGSAPGSPGLHIRRRFYAAGGRLVEATLNVHAAADRFAYALRLGGEAE